MYAAALALEWIGHDTAMALKQFGERTEGPYVARIAGLTARNFRREFVRGRIDYAHANSIGSRGVMLHYLLAPGIYETREHRSWSRTETYYIMIDAIGAKEYVSRDEARELVRLGCART